MSQMILESPQTSNTSGRKSLALVLTLAITGSAIYGLSNDNSPRLEIDDKVTGSPTSRAVTAANAFLEALDDKQKEKTLFDFTSGKKSNWSNLPASFVPRNGVKLGDLSKDQRALAFKVLASVLSKSGFQKMIDIMEGDQRLLDNNPGKGGKGGGKGGGGPMFGSDLYFLAIFGKPSETQPWMLQFGGHHLGLNVSIVGKHFILTPTHTGSQPALYKRDGKEVRPLGLENDTAFKLVNSLDEKQKAAALLSSRPQQELLLGPGRDGRKIEAKGIKGSALTDEQRTMLLDVIAAWIDITEPDSAAVRMAEIKEKVADTYFAWSGPTEKGSAAYFRIQGPSIVIEYAPQGSADHIHTVVRNPADDYGVGTTKDMK